MKPSNKKRIENLEQSQAPKVERPLRAVVIYAPSISNFNIKSFPVNAKKVLVAPDDGNCFVHGERVQRGSYRVTYSN